MTLERGLVPEGIDVVEHVPALSVVVKNRKRIGGQSKEGSEECRDGQHSDRSPKHYYAAEIVQQARAGKIAYPERHEHRNDAEHGQQGQDGA